MGQKSGSVKEPARQVVKEIRRATRRQFSAEEEDPHARVRAGTFAEATWSEGLNLA